jgi:hypothetical protein
MFLLCAKGPKRQGNIQPVAELCYVQIELQH